MIVRMMGKIKNLTIFITKDLRNLLVATEQNYENMESSMRRNHGF